MSNFIDIKTASRTLNYAPSVARKLCASGELLCKKIGGSWYVEEVSMVGALKGLQKKRFSKQISLTKTQFSKNNAFRSNIRIIKKVFIRTFYK